MKKLRNNRGETLVEVLASVLIATLSVTLLFGSVMVSSRLDRDAEKLDKNHYGALSDADAQAEALTVPPGGSTPYVVISGQDPLVAATPFIEIYGGEGMYSYKRK